MISEIGILYNKKTDEILHRTKKIRLPLLYILRSIQNLSESEFILYPFPRTSGQRPSGHYSCWLYHRILTYFIRWKYHCTGDLCLHWIPFDSLATDLLVWLNSIQSNWRSAMQWYFPYKVSEHSLVFIF